MDAWVMHPVFGSDEGHGTREKKQRSGPASIVATAVMLVFFFGQSLLNYEISTGLLAGSWGLLLLLIALRMLEENQIRRSLSRSGMWQLLHWRCLCWLDREH